MNYTCKLPVFVNAGVSTTIILNTEWSEKQINLVLLHEEKAWKGKFQVEGNDETKELLEQLSMSEEKYLEEAKTALTTHGGAENFSYSVDSEKFTWKKYVRKNMAVKFGYVSIYMLPVFEAFDMIIENTVQSHIEKCNKLAIISKENQALEKENMNLKTKLNQLMDEKREMETMLYSQFLGLLNEKKKMIEELKEKGVLPDHHSSESDSQHSDNDHFGSETEIDSEEGETHTSTKVEIVEAKGSIELEEKDTFILPKRSRSGHSAKHSAAGPSGMNISKQSSCGDVVGPRNKAVGSVTRKSKSNDCTKKGISENNVNSIPEEDLFMFPKRAKCISKNKPVGKVCYESDDETSVDNVKLEPDSDATLSLLNISEENVSFKIKNEETSNGCTHTAKTNNKSELDKRPGNHIKLSKTTLNVLNKLF